MSEQSTPAPSILERIEEEQMQAYIARQTQILKTETVAAARSLLASERGRIQAAMPGLSGNLQRDALLRIKEIDAELNPRTARSGVAATWAKLPSVRGHTEICLQLHGIDPSMYRKWKKGEIDDASVPAIRIVAALAADLRSAGLDVTRFGIV